MERRRTSLMACMGTTPNRRHGAPDRWTATATGSKPEGECSSKALFMRSFSRELTSHSFSSAFRLPRATMKGEASALSAAFRTAVLYGLSREGASQEFSCWA